MRKKKNKIFKGLTLIEMMISIAVLSLLLIVAVALFASYTKGRATIKKSEQATEEASTIMNELAKKLRMSNCDKGISIAENYNDQSCFFGTSTSYNGSYSDGIRYIIKVRLNTGDIVRYAFTNSYNNAGMAYYLRQTIYHVSADGNTITSAGITEMTDNVIGEFRIINACRNASSPCASDQIGIPLIQIRMSKVDSNNHNIIPGSTVQTAVSQRGGYYIDN